MKSFFEKLAARKINFTEQVWQIEYLLGETADFRSLRYEVNRKYLFIDNKIRMNTTSFDGLLNKTGVLQQLKYCGDSAHFYANNGYSGHDYLDFEHFKDYCECVLNVIRLLKGLDFTIVRAIAGNIHAVVQKLNHAIKKIDDYYVIVEDNYEVTQAAEIVADKYDLGNQLFLFHHSSLKGDLNGKADILCRLYKYFEGIRKTLDDNNFASLAKAIGTLSNKIDARHAPKKEAVVIDGKSREEMESIYNALFSLYLTAIITADYYQNKKSIADKYVAEFSK